MSWVMPDVRNVTEAAAADLLRGMGFPLDADVALDGSYSDTYDYSDHLGESGTASTRGPDGTIAWQYPVAGTSIEEGGAYYSFSFVIWGVPDTGLDFVTLGQWATSPDYMLGDEVVPPFDIASTNWFRVEITSLHTPTTDAEVLFTLEEFENLKVTIPKNDSRTAELTISMWNPALATNDLEDLAQYLRIYYRDQPQPVFWGPLRTEDDYGTEEGRIKITAVDALRLMHHFVRRGDDALLAPPADEDEGTLMADGSGIQYVLQAAQNTAVQDARGVPVLGIDFEDFSASHEIPFTVQRGQGVWDTIKGIADTATGPDFELAPLDDEPSIYMRLRCYDSQGTDRGRDADAVNGILFTYGADPDVGEDNLNGVRARRLLPITHAHVLDDNRKHRVTAADEDSSHDIGVYVEWVQSNFNLDHGDTTILEEIAHAYVDAYGVPPQEIEIDLRPDAAQQWFYNEDFYVGDIVSVYATKGYRGVINTHMRITAVELTQPGKRGPAVTKLTVTPQIPRSVTDEDS